MEATLSRLVVPISWKDVVEKDLRSVRLKVDDALVCCKYTRPYITAIFQINLG